MKNLFFGLILMCWPMLLSGQELGVVNEYGLRVISDIEDYQKLVAEDAQQSLVDLKKVLKLSIFDIRYAGTNNFTGRVVYTAAEAYLRKAAADSLKRVEDYLRPMGLALKIFDAYRPYQATLKFWDFVKNPAYAATPESGSRHNRGCAVDVTLVRISDQSELQMPTAFDDFTKQAGSSFMDLPEEAISNRSLLKKAMEKFGFNQLSSEWWHFDFTGWKKYPVMDVDFSELTAGRQLR